MTPPTCRPPAWASQTASGPRHANSKDISTDHQHTAVQKTSVRRSRRKQKKLLKKRKKKKKEKKKPELPNPYFPQHK
jgi:hypothetical protein